MNSPRDFLFHEVIITHCSFRETITRPFFREITDPRQGGTYILGDEYLKDFVLAGIPGGVKVYSAGRTSKLGTSAAKGKRKLRKSSRLT